MGNFISDFVDGITGRGQAEAAEDAGKLQYESAKEAREQLERLNKPYLELGEESIAGFKGILEDPRYNTFETLQNDPYGANYLSNNPLFQAAIDASSRQLKGTAAAAGKYNSGGLVDALFQNYLATGDQYWNNYLNRHDTFGSSAYNRALLPVQMGQNAASFQGTSSADLITGGANALAAGKMGSANALAAGANNLVGTGAMLYSLCDRSAKDVIADVGEDTDGLTLYRFKYKGDDTEYIGKMAQDIQGAYPDDVLRGDDGLLRVHPRHAPRRAA